VIVTPEPGIHRNIPFEHYLEWDAISNSSMQPALRSMAHYRNRPQIDETPAMRLGTLTHTGRFEPERIANTYAVMPPYEDQVRRDDGSKFTNPKGSAAYRELVAAFEEANSDKIVVTQSQFDDMVAMVTSLSKCERSTRYLTGGDYEVSIIAQDPITGLMCKGRVDHLHIHGRRIADLKTTRDASRFETVIADRSYHRQLAFYADMLLWLGKPEIKEHCIVAVESDDPYCVRSAPLSEDAIEAGRDEYRLILNAIAKSIKSKRWPGYDSPKEWNLPSWKTRPGEAVELKIGGQQVVL
jgi:hypothetical protein